MTERRSSPLRYLAPLALVGFGLALFVIVSSSPLVGREEAAPSAKRGGEERRASAGTAEERRARRRRARRRRDRLPTRVYEVKPGDTLGSISQKVGLSAERLQELNPKLDPRALGPGQKIRLRE
jgi:hypothetical protein